ncbi:uncharacterized protein (TIGR03086 family) [Mycolicibacterium iranicum]|uniref:Uncharacterized protein (TIGR03086 family) n=1 Tax=Mycolicibacterium iranicum TaxID=912594 RepID=A0A839QCH2_MYCIR|nr:TIGR03086 family metal-binding protein [Mycolicibacterium iranicum]MBB2993303.1 uncharacterized protein (TIGR03086 family) [Mycolicibacterium iranicum]
MIDMTEACARTAELIALVRDDQLAAATPCGDMTLDAVLAHIGGLSLAFEAAAKKEFGELTDAPPEMGGGVHDGWRVSYPQYLARLADAWRDPAAWEGMSRAGGVDFPADVGGMIALTEVVVHGWDVAVAAGLPYEVDGTTLAAVGDHVAAFSAGEPIEGLFGAPVPVSDDAPLLSRTIALTGRDPRWSS